ncbi:NAD-dependent DNA ligase [Vibrio nigripulchritudo ATCC 27043]|uniref:BRCT domain-containing protein n=1 Tax=Vibrio nigripulchritudo TaxID=28173 RepID=UPI00021C3860|nr:BRCT domain-containing protein [Vibrio nigripulchritudo]EGU56008.1 NAD-dependent DNA ligase [Vibrio nigripulchritudo ATCC 27043]
MTKTLDANGQPHNTNFNSKRNKQKAFQALAGIVRGIDADKTLNDTEVLFLDTWLKSDSEYKEDSDFLDLQDLIEDALQDGVIEQEELHEIQLLIGDVRDYGYQCNGGYETLVNQLLGFLQGITSDGYLNDKELEALTSLINDHPTILNTWPADVISKRLQIVFEDGVVDDNERSELLEMFKSICGQQFLETGSAECGATDFFGEPIELTNLSEKTVCFTGKFLGGNRKLMESLAKANGGIVRSGVTKDLDYLIIGSMASRDWKFSSHGRKIEAALKNQNQGNGTHIINEETWMKFAG